MNIKPKPESGLQKQLTKVCVVGYKLFHGIKPYIAERNKCYLEIIKEISS